MNPESASAGGESNPGAAPKPWEPFSFGGAARFARATLTRLAIVQGVFALLAAAAVLTFLTRAWVPVLNDAVKNLPDQASIAGGELAWNAPNPVLLGSGRFLSIVVDLRETRQLAQPAEVQLELGQRFWKVTSHFGIFPFPYPQKLALVLNRMEVESWWGAWRPVVLTGAALGAAIGVWLSWVCLATLYSVPVKMAARLFRRQPLSLGQSWKLAAAALLPGAALMSAAIAAYAFALLTLFQFVFAAALHFVIGWIYVLAAPSALPARPGSGPAGTRKKKARKNKNPFASSPRRNPFSEPE